MWGDHTDPIRIFLYHPYNLALIGLRSAMAGEPGITVVGAGGSRRLLARHAKDPDTDVIVLGLHDAARPVEFDDVRTARGTAQGPRIVVLSQDHEQGTVRAAMRAGARAFLSLDSSAEELRHAVRTVAAGGAVLCPCGAEAMFDAVAGPVRIPESRPPSGHDDLSRRERQVLGLLASGHSSAEIAELLSVTETTVRSHVHHLLGKLGLRSRAQAIAWAFQHGLVPSVPPPPSAPASLDRVRHVRHSRRVEHDLQRQLHA
ncbi:two-component system response regulator NarL [Actinophytocola sp. KF-1]